MAAARPHRPIPVIIEPASSSTAPSPASFVSSPPDPDSSTNSYNSSRPQSQHSSNTSQSEPSTPLEGQSRTPEDATLENGIELSSLAPTVLGPPIPRALEPNSRSTSSNDPPRSVPPPPTYSTDNSRQTQSSYQKSSCVSSLRARVYANRWLETTIGVLGIAVAIWLGVRGYKLAVWQSWNDLRQTCATYKQSNLALGPRCMKVLQGDPPVPPYWLHKLGTDMSNTTASKVVGRGIRKLYNDSHTGLHDLTPLTSLNVQSFVILIGIMLVLGLLLVWKARGKSKDEDVFNSAARSSHPNLQFTRHHDHGPETVSGQGVLVKRKPEDQDYPGELRRRVRESIDRSSEEQSSIANYSWSSGNTSAETLIAPVKEIRKPSSVSLQDHSANEKHEGLIELDVCGKRKAFFKHTTGEFFHISPWKSTHSEDEDSSDDERLKRKSKEKNSAHRVLGQMVAGGVSWAVGKKVDEKLAERLHEKANRHKSRQLPQRAGDCLAGEITNEWPTGRPTIV